MGIPLTWISVLGGLSAFFAIAQAQTPSPSPTSSTPLQFTMPPEANIAPAVIPNIKDQQAVDAQTVCPGYTASNVQQTASGFTASLILSGNACNVYGTDIDTLSLTVEYQCADRLHVAIVPTHISAENATHYIIPPGYLAEPKVEEPIVVSDLEFSWTNDPSFGFEVIRKSTKDVLFSTKGTKIVFENQFIEFKSGLPRNYNLYGLGESVHGFRLGNNYTKTYYAADAGATVDMYLGHYMLFSI
jgi:alpha-glucosidase